MKKLVLLLFLVLMFSSVVSAESFLACDDIIIGLSADELGKVVDVDWYGQEFEGCYLDVDDPQDDYFSLGLDEEMSGYLDASIDGHGYLSVTFKEDSNGGVNFFVLLQSLIKGLL